MEVEELTKKQQISFDNWLLTADIYRHFFKKMNYSAASLGLESALAMYRHETFGEVIGADNSYAIGKKWMDVTVKMWKEDIKAGLLKRYELENDGAPVWFLDKIGL